MKDKNLKQKSNKGITLVALIITIIVLLILAVIAISAVNNTGIIQYAQNSTKTYTDERDKENTRLENYVEILNHHNPNKKEEKDDIKRILEILALLNGLDYDKETTPQEEIDRIEAEMAKLEAEYVEIMGGKDIIGFYMQNDDYHYGYAYNPSSKKFFKTSNSEEGSELTYVLENDEGNVILAEAIEFKAYLEKEFLGKTYEEMKSMYDNNEIIPKINNEFEASKEFNDFFIQFYSDIYLSYEKASKDKPGESYVIVFDLCFNDETKKIESVEGSEFLWGA